MRIIIVCYELIQQSPSQVNELAGALLSTTITITAYERLRKPIRVLIDWVLNAQLMELLNSDLAWVSDASVSDLK